MYWEGGGDSLFVYNQLKGLIMCADHDMFTILPPFFAATCLEQLPLTDTAEMCLDSWCVLNDTDQICLIQQGDGV